MLGERVPRQLQVVQPPMPLNTYSPAATSCSGVTFAPRVRVCGTSVCTCGILLAMRVYSASVPSTIPTIFALVAHMPGPLLGVARRNERGLLREPTQPEHERHEGQEDQHAQADHLRGVTERRGGGVLARVLHHLPHVPVLTDAGA